MLNNASQQNLWSELRSVHRDLGHLFDMAFGSQATPSLAAHVVPPLDLMKSDRGWIATIALPGVVPDQIQVEVNGRNVRVRAAQPDGQPAGEFYVLEIARGTFERTFALADDIDVDRVQAAYRHGLLELTLPLKESAQPRRVAIRETSEARQLTPA